MGILSRLQIIEMSSPEKLWRLFTSEERRSAIVLLGLMMIGMLLETLGIGAVVPALALMTPGAMGTKYPALLPLLNGLGNLSQARLIIAGILILVALHTVRLLFLAFLSWRQSHFTFKLQAGLSQRLFAGYLRQPYSFHLQRNSAQLMYRTMAQVNDITNAIQQGLLVMTEVMVVVGISALLLAVEPLGAALVVSILGLAAWGFNRFARSHILRWGEARQWHEEQRMQHLQQGLGGVKDVKLLGRESHFLAQYQLHNESSARVGQRNYVLQALPRLWLEMLAVVGLAMLVLVMIWQGKPLGSVLPTLGVFAAAAFRLMPSVNRILSSVQSMRFCFPVIDTIHNELILLDATQAPRLGRPLTFKNALTLDQISFHYSSTEALALSGVSLSISRGAEIGFIGSSGAGKSTLVDILLGLLTPTDGTVRVDGVDILTSLRSWQDQIGYVPQTIFLTDDTLRRNVAFGLPNDQIDETAVGRAIHAAQLERFVNDLPLGLDTVVGERGVRLSGGQRQRIGIARALYHDPSVLVLDEATSSLDTETERGVMEAVRALKGDKTLIIVAHRLSTVKHCDRLFRLEKGRVVEEGRTLEMLRKE